MNVIQTTPERPRAFIRNFQMCRTCFRKRALQGEITGVVKSSW